MPEAPRAGRCRDRVDRTCLHRPLDQQLWAVLLLAEEGVDNTVTSSVNGGACPQPRVNCPIWISMPGPGHALAADPVLGRIRRGLLSPALTRMRRPVR